MGKINLGILGGFNGKVGTVVGYNRCGRYFMRAYNGKVRNPRTEAQMAQRKRFAELMHMVGGFLPAIKEGFSFMARANHNTECNCFMKVNLAQLAENKEAKIDLAGLMLAKGSLPRCTFGSPSSSDGEHLSVSMTNKIGGEASEEDKVCLFAYSAENGEGILATGGKRKDNLVQIEVPSNWSGGKVYVWGFAKNDSKVSNSSFIGTVTVA